MRYIANDEAMVITRTSRDEPPESVYAKDSRQGVLFAMLMIAELPTLKVGTLIYVTRATRPTADPSFLRAM